MRPGSRKIKIKFTAVELTHFGCVYLLHRFLQQLRFRSYLYHHLPFVLRNNRYSLSELLLALMYPMILVPFGQIGKDLKRHRVIAS